MRERIEREKKEISDKKKKWNTEKGMTIQTKFRIYETNRNINESRKRESNKVKERKAKKMRRKRKV